MLIRKQYLKYYVFSVIITCFFVLTGFKLVTKQKEIDSTEILIKEEKYSLAEEALNSILKVLQDVNNNNPESPEAIAKNILTPQIYFRLGDIQYKQGNYEDAIIYFDKIVNLPTRTDWNVQALYYSGMAEFYLKKYSSAREYFSRLVNDYKNSMEAPEGLYYIGLCYELENNKKQAKITFKKFLNLYPKHPWTEKVKGKIE